MDTRQDKLLLASLRDHMVRQVLRYTGTQRFLSAQLDITNACNLRCAHCYHAHHSNAGALDLGGWIRILDQYEALAKKLYLEPRFVLCGGEPTISPLFRPMLVELDRRWPGVVITILTNGTRLTSHLIESLRTFNLRFQISLDGPDARRHDHVRGEGSFSDAMAGLGNLQMGGLNATFLATLSHKSAPWIEEFFATAAQRRAAQMNFTRFVPEGMGRLLTTRSQDRPLTGVELRDAYRKIIGSSKRFDVPTNTNLPLMRLVDPDLGANGKAGFQGVIIDYQGNLKVSSRTSYKLGNILDEGLEELFLRHPVMEALRDRKISGCGTCEHYENCGGDRNASFAATGSFLMQDPSCWITTVPKEIQ